MLIMIFVSLLVALPIITVGYCMGLVNHINGTWGRFLDFTVSSMADVMALFIDRLTSEEV